MFDVGQKVICVRREPWETTYGPCDRATPVFGDEVTVELVIRKGMRVTPIHTAAEDGLKFFEYPADAFPARFFRPKVPDIEALRSLVTNLPAKQPVEA